MHTSSAVYQKETHKYEILMKVYIEERVDNSAVGTF